MSETIGNEVARQPMQPRYLFDLTTTAKNKGRMTGIPRTEFSLAKALYKMLGDQLGFVVYSSMRKDFYPVPIDQLDHNSCKQLLDSIDNTDQDFTPAAYPSQAGISFTMFTCGYAWNLHLDYTEALVGFVRANQGRLCVVIHDLIPYLFPYWIDPANVRKFNSSLSSLSQQADLFACISRNTERDFISFCENEGLTPPDSVVIRLGDHPDSSFDRFFWNEEKASSLSLDGPFVLAVGAIQQRKNYELLHAAWKQLIAARLAVPRLVIVGGCVAGGHETLRMFLEDQELARHVLIMPNVSEGQLEFLYRNALFTVYPSLYEGWGLPLCESFRLGKICLASDNSSLPEILPGYPELLSANNADQWAARIAHYTSDAEARRELEEYIEQNYRPHSWEDTAFELRECLRALSESGKPGRSQLQPLLKVGEQIEFSQLHSSIHRSAGWKEHESWGRWARGERAEISLAIEPSQPDEELVLLFKMKCSRAHAVSIHLNGDFRETCHVGMELEIYVCPLSQQDLASGNLHIELQTTNQSAKPVAAMRSVVGISQLSFVKLSSLKCQTSATGGRRGHRWLMSDNRNTDTAGASGQQETRHGLLPTAGKARAIGGRGRDEKASLTAWERLQESHAKYLRAGQRARECEKQLRKLPRQIQYRLGAALVRAIDHPVELLFAPWRVTMLLIEALRSRAARRRQTLGDGLQSIGEIAAAGCACGRQRLIVNPIRCATVWLIFEVIGPPGQRGKIVVWVNDRIVQRIGTRAETFHLIKVDLQDVVSGRPNNVSIELAALSRGEDPRWRAEIVELLVDQNDFILIPPPESEPVAISLNEPVSFKSESASAEKEFDPLGFGWKNCDQEGLNSAGFMCELELRSPTLIENPEFAVSLKWSSNLDFASLTFISRAWAYLRNIFSQKRTVLISLNDKRLCTATVSRDKYETVRLSCPSPLHGPFAIRFEISESYLGEHFTIRDLIVRSTFRDG